MAFTGFSPETLKFLSENKRRNDKEWFKQNSRKYHDFVLNPLKDLVTDLSSTMLMIDPDFELTPGINKTISRIYRDTRFSKDKSVFRDVMWIVFKRPSKNWKEDIHGYYFEISPLFYRYGMGYYSASKMNMDIFREAIDDNPESFLSSISFYSQKGNKLRLKGDDYKRPVKNTHPLKIQEWYQKKSFYLECMEDINNTLFSAEFAVHLAKEFFRIKPLYIFLNKITSV